MNHRAPANGRYKPTCYEHAANCYTHAVSMSFLPFPSFPKGFGGRKGQSSLLTSAPLVGCTTSVTLPAKVSVLGHVTRNCEHVRHFECSDCSQLCLSWTCFLRQDCLWKNNNSKYLSYKKKDKENYEDCRPWNEMNHLFKTVSVFIGKKNSPFVEKGGFFPWVIP